MDQGVKTLKPAKCRRQGRAETEVRPHPDIGRALATLTADGMVAGARSTEFSVRLKPARPSWPRSTGSKHGCGTLAIRFQTTSNSRSRLVADAS